MPDFLYSLIRQNGNVLCEVMNVTFNQERFKIAEKLLDGTYLIQTIGEKTNAPELTIRVWSQESMRAVNDAEADCEALILRYKGVDYPGYILDAPAWSPIKRGEIYSAKITFVVLEESP